MPTYRVYYNRRREAPQVFSIDEGDQTSEMNVAEFRLIRCSADSKVDLSVKPNPDTPTAWIEIPRAVLQMRNGIAFFFHDPDWRQPRLDLTRTPEQIEEDNEREVNRRINELP